MKKYINKTVCGLLILFVYSLVPLAAAGAPLPEAAGIIQKAEAQLKSQTAYSVSRMELYKSAVLRSDFEFESYLMVKEDVEYSLTLYTKPALLKGTAMLMIGDDLWLRSSSSGRVRKLGTTAKNNALSGSDFSYADFNMNTGSLLKQYTATMERPEKKDGKDCYKLLLKKNEGAQTPYTKLMVYITQKEFYFIQINFYQDKAHVKTLELTDYRQCGEDKAYPFKLIMTNHITGSTTKLIASVVELDTDRVKESYFTETYLEQLK